MSEQNPDYFGVTANRGKMQPSQTRRVERCSWAHSTLQQEVDDRNVAVPTSSTEAVHQLLPCYERPQAPILEKEALHNLQLTNTSRAFKIQPRTTAREKLGCRRPAISQAR